MSDKKEYKLYPRLDIFECEEKIKEVDDELKKGPYNYNPSEAQLQWLPLGDKVEVSDLLELRNNILSLAKDFGINIYTPRQKLTEFDRVLGLKLLEWMKISPSIAADDGIWAYLNIVLIGDFMKVRWGRNESGQYTGVVNKDRYYSSDRNYLKMLWFSAYLIGDSELYKSLSSDFFNRWMERAYTRGYDGYINKFIKVFDKHFDDFVKQNKSRINKSVVLDEYVKEARKRFAYLNWYALNDEQKDAVFEDCFNKCLSLITEN